MTDWKYRTIVVIPVAFRETVNALIEASVDPGGFDTFSLGASASGEGTPSHFYCNTKLKRSGVEFLKEISNQVPGGSASIWVDHPSGDRSRLTALIGESPSITVGEAEKIDDVLGKLALKRILPNSV